MSNGWNRQSRTLSRTRGAKVRVKTARGRKTSSTRWLQRQLNDPYVAEAQRLGYRSRAAFKLAELDEKFDLLRGAKRIADLGCAPGGWAQIIMERCPKSVELVGVDLQEVEPLAGARFEVMDFMDEGADERLKSWLGGPADLVLSDMANSATGHKTTDHIRTMALCEAALDFAIDVLAPGGAFVAKVLQGGSDPNLMKRLKANFTKVHHAKPPSSRQESTEWFVVALGFKTLPSKSD